MSTLTETEVKALIVSNLPPVDQHDEIVEAVGEGWIRLRLPFRQDYLGTDPWLQTDGVVFSGPQMMGFAETVMYSCVHGTLGRDVIVITANLMVTFLRPAKAMDIIGNGRLIRAGKRHAYVEAYLYSEGDPEPLAHVTSTYALVARPAD